MEKEAKTRISQHVGRCATKGLAPGLTASSATTLRRSQRLERKSRSRQVEEVSPAATNRDRQGLTTSRQAGPKEAKDAKGAREQDEDKVEIKVKIKVKVKGLREARARRARARNNNRTLLCPESPGSNFPTGCATT